VERVGAQRERAVVLLVLADQPQHIAARRQGLHLRQHPRVERCHAQRASQVVHRVLQVALGQGARHRRQVAVQLVRCHPPMVPDRVDHSHASPVPCGR
jgi:hypothetical protein